MKRKSVGIQQNATESVGFSGALRYGPGRWLWTSAFCQVAVGLDSRALLFAKYQALFVWRGPDRHASGSHFGGAGAKRLRGQGCWRRNANAAIVSLRQ